MRRCRGCWATLAGRQRAWCSDACRMRVARALDDPPTRTVPRSGSRSGSLESRPPATARRKRLESGFDDPPELCLPWMLAGYTNTERPGFAIERAHHTRWGTRVSLFRSVCSRCRRHGLWRQTPARAHRFADDHACPS